MQTFFNRPAVLGRPLPLGGGWAYAHAALTRNLGYVARYYQSRPFAVKNTHPIVRLLGSIGVPWSHPTERFYDIVDAKALNIGMSHKFSSSVYRGQMFDGVFYGPNVQEAIVAYTDYVNPFEVEKDWKNARAITVLDHPKSDLHLLLPLGKETSAEAGTAVIAVNIPLLALQYKCFLKEQHDYSLLTGNSPRGVGQFVHMYVLPNMLYSHLDVALFNRAVNFIKGAPMGVPTKRHQFQLMDYTAHVDKVYKPLCKQAQAEPAYFGNVLKSFPCVSTDNFETLLHLPAQAPTKQVSWVEVLARVKAIDWLTSLNKDAGTHNNRSQLNEIVRSFVRLGRDASLSQVLSGDDYQHLIAAIRSISQRVNEAS